MDAYTAAMQGTCEDAQYWDMYKSYHTAGACTRPLFSST